MIQNTSVVEYETFESYLDSQITDIDMFYLEDKELARQLVELGYRGAGEPLKRDEFESRKKIATNIGQILKPVTDQDELLSLGIDLNNNAFLSALAEREEPNRSGKLMTIIYIRTTNAKGR